MYSENREKQWTCERKREAKEGWERGRRNVGKVEGGTKKDGDREDGRRWKSRIYRGTQGGCGRGASRRVGGGWALVRFSRGKRRRGVSSEWLVHY